MTEYWLDYSAAKLSGATIRNAGYTGVVRYIDSPANLGRKHTDLSEYQSHKAAGLKVYLVFQTTTTASDGGYLVGVEHARRALAGANHLGYTGPIFFTNDRTTVPNAAAWRAYLDGAASILGIGRVGAYGFYNAMDLALGHASFFWQAGRRTDTRSHAHLWQDNNTQVTVGGITCDRNLVLKPMEDDVSLSDEYFEFVPAGETAVRRVRCIDALANLYVERFYGSATAPWTGPSGRRVDLDTSANLAALKLAGVDVVALAEALIPLLPKMPTADQVADVIAKRMVE